MKRAALEPNAFFLTRKKCYFGPVSYGKKQLTNFILRITSAKILFHFLSGMFFLITGLIIFLGLLGFLLYEVLTPGTLWRYFLCHTGSSSDQTKMTCNFKSAYEVRCLLHVKFHCTASDSVVFHLSYAMFHFFHTVSCISRERIGQRASTVLMAQRNLRDVSNFDNHSNLRLDIQWHTPLTVYI